MVWVVPMVRGGRWLVYGRIATFVKIPRVRRIILAVVRADGYDLPVATETPAASWSDSL